MIGIPDLVSQLINKQAAPKNLIRINTVRKAGQIMQYLSVKKKANAAEISRDLGITITAHIDHFINRGLVSVSSFEGRKCFNYNDNFHVEFYKK